MEMYLTSADQATLYNSFRPSPPPELIQRVIDFLKEEYKSILDTAVDVGCGSGQSTLVLAPFFRNVVGIDNCPEQINEAYNKSDLKNVTFRLGSSDFLDFPDDLIQLITAGQCAHFFEMLKFYKEVGRILQTNGVLAIYGYCLPVAHYKDFSLETNVRNMYQNTISQYVSKQSKLVYLENYKTKDFEKFPFSDRLAIREEFDKVIVDASLEDLIGYCKSWSGFQRLKKVCGDAAASQTISDFKNEILKTIDKQDEDSEEIKLTISFKYFLLLGRKVEVVNKI